MPESAKKHAYLACSAAHRWMACPGAAAAEAALPDSTSKYAAEGTAAHELAFICLSDSHSPEKRIGDKLPESGWTVDEEMAANVGTYVDFVRRLDGFVAYEQRVDVSRWVPGGFGQADCINIYDQTLRVVDLKYGRGVPVSAADNPQLKLYGLGAVDAFGPLFDIQEVTLVIHQPRLDNVSEWSIPLPALLAWGDVVHGRADAALSPGAPRIPGDVQCRFCRAQATCPALAQSIHATTMAEFDGPPPEPETLSDDQIRTIMDRRGLIVDWLRAVENYVRGRVASPEGFDGWKFVAGRANRRWADDDAAGKALSEMIGERAYVRSLLSPAAAEKALGKSNIGAIRGMIIRGEGKPTLVPAGDPRPAIAVGTSVVDDFEDVTDGGMGPP